MGGGDIHAADQDSLGHILPVVSLFTCYASIYHFVLPQQSTWAVRDV